LDWPLLVWYDERYRSGVFFFVLSGFVLTRQFLVTGNEAILIRGVAKRYFRLAAPVLLACLFSYFLFTVGAYSYAAAGAQTESPWLASFAAGLFGGKIEPLTFEGAILQGGVLCFVRGDASYNVSLWTMRLELMGSFVAFGLAFVLHCVRGYSVIVFLLVGSSLGITNWMSPYYAAFAVGVVLSFGWPNRAVQMPLGSAMFLLAAAVFVFGYFDGKGDYAFFHTLVPSWADRNHLYIIGSVALICAVLASAPLRFVLSGAFSSFVGRLSFPLYLVHFPILCSVGSSAYLATAQSSYAAWAPIAAAAATVLASVGAAVPLMAFDQWWIRTVNRQFGRVFRGFCISFPTKSPELEVR
jgi:peptidoglycan/LPS O-acetylase OafA/YrhL